MLVILSNLCGDRRALVYPQVERGAFGTIGNPQHVSCAAGESLSTWISVPQPRHVYTSPCLAAILATSHLVDLGHGLVAAAHGAGPWLENPYYGPTFLAHKDGEFGVGHPITPVSIASIQRMRRAGGQCVRPLHTLVIIGEPNRSLWEDKHMREHWGRALFDFAYSAPRSLELVIPDTPLRLNDIAHAYPGPWARASSAAPQGGLVPQGLVREWGIVCGTTSLGQAPQLLVSGNSALIYDPANSATAPFPRPRLAIYGEAILVKNGKVAGLWPGDHEDSLVGIGVLPGGTILHAVATLACRHVFARFFVEQGCKDALLVTSGESCGLMVYGDRRLGSVDGLLQSAIIVRDILPPYETLLTSRFVR